MRTSEGFRTLFRILAQKRAALLAAAFLFPAGAATLVTPWVLALRISQRIRRIPARPGSDPFRIPVWMFLGWIFVSALFSPLPAVALESWALAVIAFGIVLPTAADAVNEFPTFKGALHRAFAVGTLGAAVCGLLFLRAQHLDRAQLPGLGPNALGFGLVSGMFLTLPFLKENLVWAAGATASLTVAGITVIATFSRAALYGLVAGGLAYICLENRRLSWRFVVLTTASLTVGIIVFLGRPGVLSLFADHLQLSGRLSERTAVRDTVSFVLSPAGNSDRFPIWSSALDMMRRRPWVGVGLGVFPFVVHSLHPNIPPETPPHNLFLDIAAEAGLPAAAAFAGILGTAFVHGFRCRDSWRNAQLAALVAVLAAEVRDNILLGFHMSVGFMLLLAMVAAPSGETESESPTAKPSTEVGGSRRPADLPAGTRGTPL